FFFSSRRRHTRWPRDWSSDVCSSDLFEGRVLELREQKGDAQRGFIAEYIPRGATWDDWELMFAIRFTPGREQNAERAAAQMAARSEERRVGKECRTGWGREQATEYKA